MSKLNYENSKLDEDMENAFYNNYNKKNQLIFVYNSVIKAKRIITLAHVHLLSTK